MLFCAGTEGCVQWVAAKLGEALELSLQTECE